jgi:hypothetical protein
LLQIAIRNWEYLEFLQFLLVPSNSFALEGKGINGITNQAYKGTLGSQGSTYLSGLQEWLCHAASSPKEVRSESDDVSPGFPTTVKKKKITRRYDARIRQQQVITFNAMT